jgi:uncharacterized protein
MNDGGGVALALEEAPQDVHVGTVLPGSIPTEGFPATELREKALTRLLLSSPEKVAAAIHRVGPGGRAERYVPRAYALAGVLRVLTPGLVRRILGAAAAASLTTSTAAGEDPPPPNY